MENARVQGATKELIEEWFELLKIPEVAAIRPENTHNVDEGGLQEGKTGNGLVLGLSRARPLHRKEPGSRTWTSFIECISATGDRLPPLIIFKGKHVQDQWFPEDLAKFNDWEFTCTENGWTTDRTAIEWLEKIYLPRTRPTPSATRLLILDGHGSHITKAFQFLCYQNDVYLLYLPPHTSHVLQPLDLSVFSPMKTAYRNQIAHQAQFCCSTVVGKRLFLEAYAYARNSAIIPTNIKSGWGASGLWPVRISKPLNSPLLLQNSNKNNAQEAPSGTPRQIKPAKKARRLPNGTQRNWETPLKSRQLASQIEDFIATIATSPTKRLFFKKVRKGYELKDCELADAERKIRQLEAELEAKNTRKRKRVQPNANNLFVNNRRIWAQRNGISEEPMVLDDAAENYGQESVRSCISVDGSTAESESE